MANNVIGKIPEFTTDEETPSPAELGTEVSVASTEKAVEPTIAEETETPVEPPAIQKPAEEQIIEEKAPSEDIGETNTKLVKQIEKLKEARDDIILEIEQYRGERRKLRQEELDQVQEKIDDLKDLHPEDVNTINRILKVKGKELIESMLYNSERRNQIDNFLSEYREYSEQNDPDKKRFNLLFRQIDEYYKEPRDPKKFGELLRKAHRDLATTQLSSERPTQVKQRQAQIASAGSGGSQRSSSAKPFSEKKRQAFLDGGWSEEEVNGMEQRTKSVIVPFR